MAALEAMAILAQIWVELSTVKLLTVMPLPISTAVAAVKLVPLMVTFTVVPVSPELGFTEVTVGLVGVVTLNPLTRVPVPPAVVTETFR